MKRVGAVLAAGAVFCAQVTPAYACGPGLAYQEEQENAPPPPEYYPLFEPLRPPESYASWFQPWTEDEDFILPEQIRFNYPFKLAPDVGPRWEALNGRGEPGGYLPDDQELARVAEQDLKDFVAALGRDDRAEAHRLALRAVEQVLDMPALIGQQHALTLRRAVEFLELEPSLARVPAAVNAAYFSHQPTPAALPAPLDALSKVRGVARDKAGEFARTNPKNPRVPSLQFVDMQEQLKRGLPDGWSAREKPSPEILGVVKAVRQTQQAWLAAWPQHPLADLVRLMGVRLSLAEGDTEGAWKAALSVYPRHRMRAVAEWNYLLNLDQVPKDLAPFRADPYLRTALVLPSLPLSAEQWAREWASAVAHAQEPWAVLLQERLLYLVVEDSASAVTLPKGVPSPAAPAPNPEWARLRVAALLKAGRSADALKALESLTPADETPALRASLALALGRPQEAAQVKGLDEHARAYLLRTRLSDADLQALARSAEAPLAAEVAQVRAERRIAQGDWAGAAAAVKEKAPARASRYEAIARLAADTSSAGQLALARALRDQAAALLPLGEDVEWYRSVSHRLEFLSRQSKTGAPKEEGARARAVLLAGNARVFALEAFARYLAARDTHPAEARRVLGEADGVYNALINWDKETTTFYRDTLKDSSAAKAIRAAGLRLKNVK